jgi:hypothetical protein
VLRLLWSVALRQISLIVLDRFNVENVSTQYVFLPDGILLAIRSVGAEQRRFYACARFAQGPKLFFVFYDLAINRFAGSNCRLYSLSNGVKAYRSFYDILRPAFIRVWRLKRSQLIGHIRRSGDLRRIKGKPERHASGRGRSMDVEPRGGLRIHREFYD